MRNAAKYDSYDRKGPKVYVGEYAVTQGCGQGNLRAAVGEAAFMTGMERNSDVVVMASYAPLFVNVGWRQWNPDAIDFDSSPRLRHALLLRAEDVQREPRRCRAADWISQSPERREDRSQGGAIGVGTWATQAEFKDIKVTHGDKVLFQSRLHRRHRGLEDARAATGKPRTASCGKQRGDTNIRAIAGDKSWTDYTYTLKARKLGGSEGFLILFNVQDEHAEVLVEHRRLGQPPSWLESDGVAAQRRRPHRDGPLVRHPHRGPRHAHPLLSRRQTDPRRRTPPPIAALCRGRTRPADRRRGP